VSAREHRSFSPDAGRGAISVQARRVLRATQVQVVLQAPLPGRLP